jgi:hypothetical protein
MRKEVNMKEKLKQFVQDRPLEAIMLGTFVVGTAAKVIDVLSAAQGRRAYAKQVNYRVRR